MNDNRLLFIFLLLVFVKAQSPLDQTEIAKVETNQVGDHILGRAYDMDSGRSFHQILVKKANKKFLFFELLLS
jgi:hypothetical protein